MVCGAFIQGVKPISRTFFLQRSLYGGNGNIKYNTGTLHPFLNWTFMFVVVSRIQEPQLCNIGAEGVALCTMISEVWKPTYSTQVLYLRRDAPADEFSNALKHLFCFRLPSNRFFSFVSRAWTRQVSCKMGVKHSGATTFQPYHRSVSQ